MKVNWKDARKEWPSHDEPVWAFMRDGAVKFGYRLLSHPERMTHWAEIEYPEPPEEEKKVSALEMWCEQHCTPEGYILTSVAQQVARKLIEVMEERGYDHPHRAAGIDYNQGYIDGRQETINYIKRWCEEE